ncbi:GNAT family N-acetyltransferase [Actinospica robiniae]|uniref:GNAT family N-acetyltransferase n=1 Tax=Actinospica robiniae TaxID=304901 RepID=UPI0012FA5E00|nr:GNAT family N-acetyltransferase [Actinospica robiniae]
MNLTERHAADICTWRYPAPYQCYDLAGADPAYFLAPANGFFALVDDEGKLLGYRSFGPDGQVPGGAYDDAALDTGGGLRPELTGLGRGLGRRAIATGLAFGRERLRPTAFRVTVADFNVRARQVVESLGFVHVSSFAATTDSSRFHVFLLSAASCSQLRGPTSPTS